MAGDSILQKVETRRAGSEFILKLPVTAAKSLHFGRGGHLCRENVKVMHAKVAILLVAKMLFRMILRD
jgi:hypothetical protein